MTCTLTPSAREFVEGTRAGLAVLERIAAWLDPLPHLVEVRTTRTQVAFRRRRAFAFVWRPGMALRSPRTQIALSIATPSPIASPRWAEVAHPSPRTWMHHLDVADVATLDDEVRGWLLDASDAAG